MFLLSKKTEGSFLGFKKIAESNKLKIRTNKYHNSALQEQNSSKSFSSFRESGEKRMME